MQKQFIPRRKDRRSAPLSFAQQRLWFLDQLEPNSPRYNVSRALRLRGDLDLAALQKSLAAIVSRHEALRSNFREVDGIPVQVIGHPVKIPTIFLDLSDQPVSEGETGLVGFLNEQVRCPYDLSSDLMLRASLVRLSPHDHVLLLVLPHITADGWSMIVLCRELIALYDSLAHGKPCPLPDLLIQYADFAAWQREWLQGEVLENQLSYWTRTIGGVPRLELPTDYSRPALPGVRNGVQTSKYPKALADQLNGLARSERTTLFMILLAAFKTLLCRYTGQDDIAVGCPIANRRYVELEGLIGFFANTLVFRSSLSANPTFRELLARVREVALGAYEHQDLPFEKLVEELQPDRDLSRSPLFQVTFQLRNYPNELVRLSDLTIEPLELKTGIAKFDLSLAMTNEVDGLKAELEYNPDLFESATIARMFGHFQVLLEGIIANPDQRISDLPLLTEEETHQLLVGWNDTRADYPRDKCIHQLFETQVEKTPDAVAVVFEDQQLTYRELNNRANQLAHYLHKLGVGPEVLVGICVERSIEMIVGLLGILKAGGAYVPLDPSYPNERLAFMLEDTQAKALLTQKRLAAELDRRSKIEDNDPRTSILDPQGKVICVDGDWDEVSKERQDNPHGNAAADNVVYVIYTSGSTGRPKGVAVEHRQLINYLVSIVERLDLTSQRSFATVSTLAADLGNTVIFPSLCTGATLHVISRDRIADAEAMADYFNRHAIDCLKIVPSHLAALQSLSHPERVLPRQLLILGGEASDVDWVKRLATLAPNCRIVNHYGPTETTVGVITYAVEKDSFPGRLPHLPLGWPIANTQVYILDQNLKPIPIGVAGEICVGGLGLARGYLNRPELTAERFIPNPFSAKRGARLYKTGDRARYLADGNIEFIGRIDNQIKLRGYRIEPGEIEVALKQHPEVRDAVVLDRPGTNGEKQLAAYVIVTPDQAPTVAGKPRYRLPNGTAVVQLNKNETDYIYQEIFERQAYLRHGITIRDGDCIFDVGANIGLFTVFAHQFAKRPRTYSFEPNPTVYEILKANAKLYGFDVRLFNCGLSDIVKSTTFTFFPGFSLLSGFYADAQAEKEVVKTFMINQQNAGISAMTELVEQADAILEERFAPQSFNAELRTVSSVIEQDEIEYIDLLKINVEKSELDVLLGIKESDWQKIQQIVLEVDVKENLPTITSLLERHGYEYVVEQDNLLEGTPLCYVYAIRPSEDRQLIREQPTGTHVRALPVSDRSLISAAELRAFLATKLPEHMIPSALVFLDALPLTTNGKVDRQALRALDQDRTDLQENFEAPRTPMEELLAQIWSEVLKLDKVGVHDNFFDLGGHSLLATQIISRVNNSFQINIQLRRLFELPTIAGLAASIDASLGIEKDPQSIPPIVPAPRSNEIPLSFAQQRLWFLDLLEPESATYIVSAAFRLVGELHVLALEQSLNEIVRRHEVLRTVFTVVNDTPVQKVLPPSTLSLICTDISDRPEKELEQALPDLLSEEAKQPFDLSRGPLIRAKLLRLDPQEHVVVLNMHHIVFDGWSMGVLFRELSVLYEGYCSGKPSSLPELQIQYADYSVWQHQWLQGEELEHQLVYWRNKLDGLSTLQLPTDRVRPAVQTFRGSSQVFSLSEQLSRAIKTLSQRESVTPFMTLLAAFQVLLSRYCGQADVAVGSPIAGRNRQETEGLIGFFVNTLVLRADLSNNPTFKQLLREVRETTLEAYSHQDLPFEKLVDELHPDRNLSSSPLFQVMFTFHNNADQPLEFERLTVDPIQTTSHTAKFDLSLTMSEKDGTLRGSVNYNTDLFDDSTIERMIGHFQTLLEGIVSNPEWRISELPLLTEAEKVQLLVEWNDTKRDYPSDKCIHQLFEEQVARTPEAVAVVFEDQQLTYRELNNRANQLAHYLQKFGIGPEVLVGLCVERSIEMVVGLLGILKAGGAYVPLDPSYPKDRLAFMIQDTQVPVILTDVICAGKLPPSDARVIRLDEDWKEISQEARENPQFSSTPSQLACVIYTSGSTGQPKGVMVSHRALATHTISAVEHYGLGSIDRVLQFASLSFDVAAEEIFPAWLSGAAVVLLPERTPTIDDFVDYLIKEGITVVNLPSAYWHQWVDELDRLDKKLPPSLRLLIVGNEKVLLDHFERWHQAFGGKVRWLNAYGPTEATITAAVYEAPQGDENYRDLTSVPIGRPMPNRQIYILDQYLQPVPIGVTGEIFIDGPALALGYLNNSELTAEKFIANPFCPDSSARLYRTGDLGRYLPDGNIEFLGRIDNQVKIRGYRIELGEIEAVLGQHPAVREAIVLAREGSSKDSTGSPTTDKRLVAYVVAPSNTSTNELRSFLKQKLPDYMIPSAFVFLDALPLTPNGKLDRKALPAPDQSRPELEETLTAPRNPVEEIVASIWAEVLKLEKVGIQDNFFDLGGHSLLATQVVSRIGRALQVELPLRALFETPTVAGLAERVEEARRKEQGLQALPILPVSRDKDIPLSFSQQRLWFLDQYEPNSSVYNIPSAIRLTGALDVSALEQSVQEMFNRHEALRTTFSTVEGQAVQVIAPSLKLALPVIDLSETAEAQREEQARLLAQEEARRPFDLSQGPLFRARLLQLGKQDHVLLMTLHHIVSDGWSMGVMYHELSVLYQAFCNSQPSPLADLSIQYADYAVWQREWLKGEELERQISYWKKQLEGISPLQLPTDRPRPPVQTHRGARQSLVLSQELTEQLKTLSRQEGATLYMTLLAAFQTLLHRYSGQDDIAVGSPIAGRNRAEIEGLIGFFINSLVMRTNFSGDPSFKELLCHVREVSLGAYAHQDIPFEKVLEELRPERDLSRSPLFQVFLNVVNVGERQLKLSGLKCETFSTADTGSKVDLTIYVRERGEAIQLDLVYNADLYESARMAEMLRQLNHLLCQVVENPEQPIRDISLVTASAAKYLPDPTQPLRSDWNGSVHTRFSEQARSLPHRAAIVSEQEIWTYQELDLRSSQLANYLLANGIQSQDVVAIYGHRSASLVWALLGVLKAGGAFLILDPAYPASRLIDCLKVAKPRGWIQVEAAGAVPDALDEFIAVSSLRCRLELPRLSTVVWRDPLSGYAADNPGVVVGPEDLAYVAFTSGTTGHPEGILGKHGSLSHFLPWRNKEFNFGASDRFSMLSGLCHDPLHRDIFTPLWLGATLCVPDSEIIGTPALARWMADEKVTIAHMTPPMAQLLDEAATPDFRMPSLRYAFFVGEELTRHVVDRLRRLAPGVTCVNFYGTTETQQALSYYVIAPESGVQESWDKAVYPLGRGTDDVQLLVLTADPHLAGVGELGEIYFRSPHLAQGYLGDEALTQARFLTNPFTGLAGDRLYKTGDLGRYLADGNVEFAGRIDNQVKIRGFRIELGEVEAALAQHPAVRECAVLAREDTPGEKQLAAYVVQTAKQALPAGAIRNFLKTKLPGYMVPSAFIVLDTFPLTPNGKVDRSALPAPDQSRTESADAYVAPRTPIEQLLSQIWADVLKLDKVGVHDNFFDLGGHSLLATQAVSRMRAAFYDDISLRNLFEAPTIEDLAAMITERQAKQLNEADLKRILSGLEAMSDEDAERTLAQTWGIRKI